MLSILLLYLGRTLSFISFFLLLFSFQINFTIYKDVLSFFSWGLVFERIKHHWVNGYGVMGGRGGLFGEVWGRLMLKAVPNMKTSSYYLWRSTRVLEKY